MNQELNLVDLIYEFNSMVATVETHNTIQIQDQVLRIVDFFFQKPKTNAKFLVSKSSILRILIDSFRLVRDFEIQQDLIQVLFQVTLVKYGSKRIVEFNGTEAIFESISLFPSAIPENFTIHFILLAKLSEKDAKFSTKFRCFHLTTFLLENLRYYSNDFDHALPVITVFHRCAISPTTCIAFRKHFAMRILLSYLDNASLPLHHVVSICIDSIRLLVKNKGILALTSWKNLVDELVRFYSLLMFDFKDFKGIFDVLELFKDISRIPRGHAVMIDSNLFTTLRDTLAKFQLVTMNSELKDRFVKLNLEIIQDFILRKNLAYPCHNSEIQIDDYKKQISMQSRISPKCDGKFISSPTIEGLHLFFEECLESKSRNFSLTIQSLIDLDSLSMYCFNSTAKFDAQTLLSEFFRTRKPDHIIDPKLTQFSENLQKHSNYFAYSTKSYSISPKFHTFLSPTICGEPTQLYQKENNITLSIALAKLNIINQPIYSIEKEVFRQKIIFIDPLLNPKRVKKDNFIHSPLPMLDNSQSLEFSADFESSNLLKITEINTHSYDVILRSDTTRHVQWFLFKVTNMDSSTNYTFKFVNFEKNSSQFSSGMQPLIFSRKSNRESGIGWFRIGSLLYYGDSDYIKLTRDTNTTGKLYSLTFNLNFPFDNDECYIAYHFPYTYTNLQHDISNWVNTSISNMYLKIDTLCYTYTGIPCPLVTITDFGKNVEVSKEYIVLSARVHPGESNSSWMIKSIIEMLLTDDPIAVELRSKFIFKIVPMLNPDGVIYGYTRCNLLGFDLNRQWHAPSPNLHPTIYHTKALIQRLISLGKQPLIFCDFHGHSLKKNLFMYGCNSHSKIEEILPSILAENYAGFDLQSCSNTIEKSKLHCGRVVVGTNLDIPCSYTLELTYCGFNQGEKKDFQITLEDFREIGHKFLQSLLEACKIICDRTDNVIQNSCIE